MNRLNQQNILTHDNVFMDHEVLTVDLGKVNLHVSIVDAFYQKSSAKKPATLFRMTGDTMKTSTSVVEKSHSEVAISNHHAASGVGATVLDETNHPTLVGQIDGLVDALIDAANDLTVVVANRGCHIIGIVG
jgi:hypothetical protein